MTPWKDSKCLNWCLLCFCLSDLDLICRVQTVKQNVVNKNNLIHFKLILLFWVSKSYLKFSVFAWRMREQFYINNKSIVNKCLGGVLLSSYLCFEGWNYIKNSDYFLYKYVVVQSLKLRLPLCDPWAAACQVSLSFTICRSLLKPMSFE